MPPRAAFASTGASAKSVRKLALTSTFSWTANQGEALETQQLSYPDRVPRARREATLLNRELDEALADVRLHGASLGGALGGAAAWLGTAAPRPRQSITGDATLRVADVVFDDVLGALLAQGRSKAAELRAAARAWLAREAALVAELRAERGRQLRADFADTAPSSDGGAGFAGTAQSSDGAGADALWQRLGASVGGARDVLQRVARAGAVRDDDVRAALSQLERAAAAARGGSGAAAVARERDAALAERDAARSQLEAARSQLRAAEADVGAVAGRLSNLRAEVEVSRRARSAPDGPRQLVAQTVEAAADVAWTLDRLRRTVATWASAVAARPLDVAADFEDGNAYADLVRGLHAAGLAPHVDVDAVLDAVRAAPRGARCEVAAGAVCDDAAVLWQRYNRRGGDEADAAPQFLPQAATREALHVATLAAWLRRVHGDAVRVDRRVAAGRGRGTAAAFRAPPALLEREATIAEMLRRVDISATHGDKPDHALRTIARVLAARAARRGAPASWPLARIARAFLVQDLGSRGAADAALASLAVGVDAVSRGSATCRLFARLAGVPRGLQQRRASYAEPSVADTMQRQAERDRLATPDALRFFVAALLALVSADHVERKLGAREDYLVDVDATAATATSLVCDDVLGAHRFYSAATAAAFHNAGGAAPGYSPRALAAALAAAAAGVDADPVSLRPRLTLSAALECIMDAWPAARDDAARVVRDAAARHVGRVARGFLGRARHRTRAGAFARRKEADRIGRAFRRADTDRDGALDAARFSALAAELRGSAAPLTAAHVAALYEDAVDESRRAFEADGGAPASPDEIRVDVVVGLLRDLDVRGLDPPPSTFVAPPWEYKSASG
ncbi:hypothetical protein M885DRAFT_224790 [Pelagophyceae sp. CCMP2097]|nr:hypothetical protein M885DRAFT_224790 [Pelagophyceae sp. CCMP2097]